MGQRVDNASNEVVDLSDHPNSMLATEEAIFCPTCGTPDADVPQGFGTVVYAETSWIEQNGHLYCCVYCAAKGVGLSEKQALLARAMAAQAQMRRDGLEAEAETDERLVRDVLENPENHPFAPAPEEVMSDEATDHHDEPVVDVDTDEFDEILARVSEEGGEE